jgi:ADP-ribose pyrophosphatase
MNFKINQSEIIYRGKVFDLQVDEITYDSGNKGIREIALHDGGAVILPLKDDRKIVMIRQFRYPFNEFMIELPAGKLDKGENPFNCASRELEEETGYKSNNIIRLGSICTTPGFCSEILHLYLAKDLVVGEHNREEGETGMQVLEFSVEDVEKKIKQGEITDAKTICAMYLAENYLS